VKQGPFLHIMPRIHSDFECCLEFVARQPWGRPNARRRDILKGFKAILRHPGVGPVRVRRPAMGLEFRARSAAQFVIVYTYLRPNGRFPNGCVSLRAIRHRRVRNVFSGVRDRSVVAYGGATRPLNETRRPERGRRAVCESKSRGQ
jgi:hypothetical protein